MPSVSLSTSPAGTPRLGRSVAYVGSEKGTSVLMPSLPPESCRTTRIRFFLLASSVTSPAARPGAVPSSASAVRVMNDGARKPEATSKAPRPMRERRVRAMVCASGELVRGHGQGQMDQAARPHVDGGAVVERRIAGCAQVVDQGLPRLGRRIALDQQAKVEVDQPRPIRDAAM